MTRIPVSMRRLNSSPEFPFISGRFSEGVPPVAYFLTAMKYGEAKDSLRLVSELPGAASVDWELEELYQRDVSWKRVTQRIVPYLKQRDRPQFFNALTIALLPIRDDRIVGMSLDGWRAPDLEHPERFAEGRIAKFGPVTCGYYEKWLSPDEDSARLGCIRWNKDQVAAVAIDGQHRLAAIKEYCGTRTDFSTSIPVILIVAHPDLCGIGDSAADTVRLTRRLFIDLNKHSVKVSRARQILLDDHDPISVCTRALVGSRLLDGDSELLKGRLPLTLVDWHSEQAKFDSGPYLTTILGLDGAASVCVGIEPVIDPMRYGAWEDAIEKFRVNLGLTLEFAEARLDTAKMVQMPFEFSFEDEERGELAEIRSAFIDSWSRALVQMLTALGPYKRLLELRRDDGTLSPDFASWWSAKARTMTDGSSMASSALTSIESDLNSRFDPRRSPVFFAKCVERYEQHKKGHELAFTVAFQRALLSGFNRFLSAPLESAHGPLAFGSADQATATSDAERKGAERLRRAQIYVKALDAVLVALPDFFDRNCEVKAGTTRRLWAYSLLREDNDSVDFTGGASERASDLLACVTYLFVLQQDSDFAGGKFELLWTHIKEAETGDQLPFKLRQAVQRMTKETGIAGRIVKAMDPPVSDEERVEELRWKEAKIRLCAIWNALGK